MNVTAPKVLVTVDRETIFGRSTKVFQSEEDLCDYTKCPIVAGRPSNITISAETFIPRGEYSLMMHIIGDFVGTENLACIEVEGIKV